jgi:hypothetical protein
MSDRAPFFSDDFDHALGDGNVGQLCLYPGRPCHQLRDHKHNGNLHRFCPLHRQLYNQYQRDSLQRRRLRDLARAEAITLAQVELPVGIEHVVFTNEVASDAEFLGNLRSLFDSPQTTLAPVEYRILPIENEDDILDFIEPEIDQNGLTDEIVNDAELLEWLLTLFDSPQARFTPAQYPVGNIAHAENVPNFHELWNS